MSGWNMRLALALAGLLPAGALTEAPPCWRGWQGVAPQANSRMPATALCPPSETGMLAEAIADAMPPKILEPARQAGPKCFWTGLGRPGESTPCAA